MTEESALLDEVFQLVQEKGSDIEKLKVRIDRSMGQAIDRFDETGGTSLNFVRVIRALLAFQHGAERILASKTEAERLAAERAMVSLETEAVGLYNLLAHDAIHAQSKGIEQEASDQPRGAPSSQEETMKAIDSMVLDAAFAYFVTGFTSPSFDQAIRALMTTKDAYMRLSREGVSPASLEANGVVHQHLLEAKVPLLRLQEEARLIVEKRDG